jgi:hypothetical protein
MTAGSPGDRCIREKEINEINSRMGISQRMRLIMYFATLLLLLLYNQWHPDR